MKYRDEELVDLILSGDAHYYSEIVKRYKNKIYRLGLKFFKSELDAEDYSQNLFIHLFNKLHTFRGEAAFSSWLYRLAYNLAINMLRMDYTEEFIDKTDERPNPEKRIVKNELYDEINKAMNTLPNEYKVSLHLFYFENMKLKKIADIMGIKINTVKSHLRRGKVLLKKRLDNYFGENQ